tara:strand:+ start:327 stop:713 length:387 start_codon:yes stop_codon:yes gene_type:complete
MANGTIAFDTLSTSGQITGTAKSVDTDYIVKGSAKTTVAATDAAVLFDSLNVSSGVDEGTGDYKYNLTAAFSATTLYLCNAGTCLGASNVVRVKSAEASTILLDLATMNSSFSSADASHSVATFGDLA